MGSDILFYAPVDCDFCSLALVSESVLELVNTPLHLHCRSVAVDFSVMSAFLLISGQMGAVMSATTVLA